MTEGSNRYAVYFTPPHGSPLERFGAATIGYDCYTGEALPPVWLSGIEPDVAEILTSAPRRYGFHATLKAPFRLAENYAVSDLQEAARAFVASRPPLAIGCLRPVLLDTFVALVPADTSPALERLAAECVAHFDCYRAPLVEAERARRQRDGLTVRQSMLLERWGYPHVFDEFRFHMTLTGALPAETREVWLTRVVSELAPIADAETSIDAITLLGQEPGKSFKVIERFAFSGAPHG